MIARNIPGGVAVSSHRPQDTIAPGQKLLPVASDWGASKVMLGITVLMVWGVLMFGAVYPWAYWPLLVGAAAFGSGAAWAAESADRSALRPFAAGLILLVSAALLQLVPLPRDVLVSVSPAADGLLRQYDPAYAAGLRSWHPLSIDPAATWRGLAFLVSLGVVTYGLASVFPRVSLRPLPRNVLILGALVALLGLAQRVSFNGRLYWFWVPRFDASNAFGPFVNRNHFAAWMLMAISLGAGYLCALSAESTSRVAAPGWRNRLLWFASLEANRMILAMAAIVTMSTALAATLSRSGILGFAVVLALFAVHAARHLPGVARRSIVAAFFIAAFVLGIAWKGFGTVANWYGNTGTFEWRLGLWRDTVPILRDFVYSGTGLNAYGTATLLYPMSDPVWHAMEAHSDYLQIATEGGLLLGIPLVLTIAIVVREVRRRFQVPHTPMRYWLRLGAVIGVAGIAVQETVEFSLQIPGNAVLFAVLLATALHPVPPAVSRQPGAKS